MKNIQSSFPGLLQVLGLLCFFLASCNASSSDDTLPVVPIIDLTPWTTPNTNSTNDSQMEVVRQIHEACQSVGFFLVINHGLDSQVLQDAWMATQEFFELPGEEKLKHKTTNEAEYPYGYEQSEKLVKGKQLDGANNNLDEDSEAAADLKETFAIGPENEDSGMPRRRWIASSVSTFQQALEDYYAQMEELALNLLRVMALALEQPETYFDDKMGHHLSALRLVHYYPLDPPLHQEQVVRAGAHTDYGALTILNAQDTGLQIFLYDDHDKTTGRWYPVPLVPGALIINLGDLMQRWTNDKWVSTLHRVVMPSTEVLERRYSMAYFVNINGDTLVEPLCQNGGETPKYPPISARDHLMAKHLASMGETDDASHSEL